MVVMCVGVVGVVRVMMRVMCVGWWWCYECMYACMHEPKCRLRLAGNLEIHAPFSTWATGGRASMYRP